MIETLLIVIILLQALQLMTTVYILLHIAARTVPEEEPPAKRVRLKVQQSKEARAMEKALDKFDGGLSK